MSKEYLTKKEVAELLSCSLSQIYYLEKRGDLPVIRIGRLVRFDRQAIEEMMRGRLDSKWKAEGEGEDA